MNPDELTLLAQKAESSSKAFLKKNRKKLEKMDSVVLDLHNEVMSKTNCLHCANCCRSLGPLITNKDIDQIAKALRIKSADVIATYLKIDEDGDFVFINMPCPFLLEDNYCSIYEHRPKACREYPHTDRPKFYRIFNLTIKNAYTCPVAYEVLEKLKLVLK